MTQEQNQSASTIHRVIEPKWQQYWDENKTFKVLDDDSKPKFYALDMFPYPSGAGLHVGHPEGYTATDIVARYKRMRRATTCSIRWAGTRSACRPSSTRSIPGSIRATSRCKNINNFRRQIKSLGFSYDWDREISTTDPDYYKWTQWIFLQLYKRGLAYVAEVPVNWCPALGTVLANEEVIDGKSERGGHPVIRKPMRQWMLKITEYAERLLEDLEELDWPESIKEMQRNWIGKSEGRGSGLCRSRERTRSCASLRPDRTRCSAQLTACWRRSIKWVDEITTPEQKASSASLQRTSSAQERPGADGPGEGEDGRLHRRVCHQSGQRRDACRSGSPIMCWQATVRARSWRFRGTTSATGSSRRSSTCRSSRSSRAGICPRKPIPATASTSIPIS